MFGPYGEIWILGLAVLAALSLGKHGNESVWDIPLYSLLIYVFNVMEKKHWKKLKKIDLRRVKTFTCIIHLDPCLFSYVRPDKMRPFLVFPAYNEFPRNVFITHNHLDHAGELPMLFASESKRRYLAGEPRLRVLSGPEVEYKLKTHRLDEMLSLFKPVSVIAFSGALLATALRGAVLTPRKQAGTCGRNRKKSER